MDAAPAAAYPGFSEYAGYSDDKTTAASAAAATDGSAAAADGPADDGKRPRRRPRTTVWTGLRAVFEPSMNRLSMKIYGSEKAVLKERLRQRSLGAWVIHPCSKFRFYWDLCMLLLLVANLIILPVGISFFNDDFDTRWIIFNCLSDTIFLVDIIVNFRTGILQTDNSEQVILEPKLIARNYLRSWFFLDLISSLPLDYLFLMFNQDVGEGIQILHAGRALRILRLAKLLSLVRLLRLSRLVRYVNQWEEVYMLRIRSDMSSGQQGQIESRSMIKFLNMASVFMRIFNLICMMLLIGHWSGCLQFLVPSLQGFPANSWVAINELQDANWAEQYSWSLFKAMSHMLCIGYGRFPPQSLTDMWLTMLSMISGATCYALFLGHATNLIQSLDSSRRQYREKVKQVEEYMSYRRLPLDMRKRITEYFEHRYQGKFFDEKWILDEMSDKLREDVRNYTCRRLVTNLPLLQKADTNLLTELTDCLEFEMFQPETLCGPHEKRLLNDLLDPYNTLERPVANESEPLQLSFGLMLMQIIDVDEKNQLLITNMWLKLEWNDVNLRWNHSDYGGVKDLRIPPHKIWKPDMLMYNSADEGFDGTYATNVVVNSNGSCVFIPPGIFKSTCKIDITWFPFDDQKCDMKFGSWTYDGFQLDLQLQDDNGGDISGFITNGEWDLLGVPGKRNVIYYSCCPEPYIDITFSILIRRRTLYYFFNLIVPCVLIASMAVLGFTLPPDCGEKLSLGVTILLSLTVFLNMVAETMPATSDAVPLLGTYFNCIMFMVASSVVSTIMILNYHHRNADTHVMSKWVKLMFLVWMPCLLCMSRPARDDPPGNGNKSDSKNKSAASSIHHLPDLEFRAKSSRSLLANVLDLDDDLRSSTRSYPGARSQVAPMPEHVMVEQQQQQHAMMAGGGGGVASAASSCLGPHRELSLILKELRVITDKLRKDEEDEEITNDWKFAAMVVDRMCLYIFTFFTVAATIAVLMSAPHVIVT